MPLGFGLGIGRNAPRGGAPAITPLAYANLALWLRSDTVTLASPTTISGWPDKSGNAADATVAVSTVTYSPSGGVNSLPVVQPNGLRTLTGTFAAAVGARTLFVVGRFAAAPTNAALFAGTNASFAANSGFALFQSGSTIIAREGGGGDASTADISTLNTVSLYETTCNAGGTSEDLVINGTSKATVNPAGVTSSPNYTVAALNGTNLYGLNGDLYEVVLFSAVLDSASRSDLRKKYFGPRYGITIP